MKEHNCETCKFRKKYEDAPKSLLGRLWRFHANWCPGWKSYMKSLPDTERKQIAGKYEMTKFMQ